MNKKLIRLTESDLHKIVKKSVNKVLKEEIGTGEFPNPDALVNITHNRVEQALLNAGFKISEYGDDIYGNGVETFVNDETGETVEITYKWSKQGNNHYKSGKVKDAYVWRDNGEDTWSGKR